MTYLNASVVVAGYSFKTYTYYIYAMPGHKHVAWGGRYASPESAEAAAAERIAELSRPTDMDLQAVSDWSDELREQQSLRGG